jgi:DNA-binding response OmpR family regulator
MQGSGWTVLEADTVLDALRHLDKDIKWVILDLMLLDGDGIAVLERIRNGGLPIKVAVVTAVGDFERLTAVNSLGPEFIMRKPININELLDKLASNNN